MYSVADPRFSREGGVTLEFGAKTYYLAKFSAENCMKIKEIGPKRGFVPSASRSANGTGRYFCLSLIWQIGLHFKTENSNDESICYKVNFKLLITLRIFKPESTIRRQRSCGKVIFSVTSVILSHCKEPQPPDVPFKLPESRGLAFDSNVFYIYLKFENSSNLSR